MIFAFSDSADTHLIFYLLGGGTPSSLQGITKNTGHPDSPKMLKFWNFVLKIPKI